MDSVWQGLTPGLGVLTAVDLELELIWPAIFARTTMRFHDRRPHGAWQCGRSRRHCRPRPRPRRIRFVYTPRHASWLNQVEIGFSILARRALKRASFSSLDELRERLLAFIDYFNAAVAKPFRWTYAGKPLQK